VSFHVDLPASRDGEDTQQVEGGGGLEPVSMLAYYTGLGVLLPAGGAKEGKQRRRTDDRRGLTKDEMNPPGRLPSGE
jgi:hypothetical protein